MLKVRAAVQFDNATIPTRWIYSKRFSIHNIIIDMALLTHIEDYAFDTDSFRHLYSLIMTNLAIQSLGPNTLQGLDNLSILELRSSLIIRFPPILPPIANTIFRIHITGNDLSRSQTQSIDQLSNGFAVDTLQHLIIHLNLMDSLNRQSFVNYGSIQFLDLSSCRIQYLVTETFYPIRKTLIYLDLGGNFLKNLPIGMLTYILTKPILGINLEYNPWKCDCHLLELQRAMINDDNMLYNNVLCQEPFRFSKIPVVIAPFCGQPDGLSSSHLIKSMQCRVPLKSYMLTSMKIIKKRSKTFGIQRINNDVLKLTVLDDYKPSRMVYVLHGSKYLNRLRLFTEIPYPESSLALIYSEKTQNRL